MQPVSAALRALLPPPEAPEADYLPAFRRIADLLLNRTTWRIGQVPHRIVEIELYWDGAGHLDTFTHGDPLQREFGRWYFHRQGGEYRGGTYKGLDLAIGRDDVAAGILIRGAAALSGPTLDGPCTCVDHLLATTGHASVRALAESFDRAVDPPAGGGSPLYLEPADDRGLAIAEGPRVGLTLKRGVLAERARFLARPYRFLSEPAKIKKGRLHAVIGLHRQGLAADQIAARTGSTVAQVGKYLAQYEAGRAQDPRDFVKDLGADDTCRLLGACDAFDAAR